MYDEVPVMPSVIPDTEDNYGGGGGGCGGEMTSYREAAQDLVDVMSSDKPEPCPLMLREVDDNIREYQQMEQMILGNLSA